MRFMHVADLHIGKKLNGFPLLDDQRHVLRHLVGIVADRHIDAVLIAGDVYDRPVPQVSAVRVLDEFLVALRDAGAEVFMVAGNHDSAGRLGFLSSVVGEQGIHIARPYEGVLEAHALERGGVRACIWLLPFVAPADVRRHHPQAAIESYDDALRTVVENADLSEGACNILVAHQLVVGTGPLVRSESEQITIGGLDHVGAGVFDAFDYVALGHIHAPQWVRKPTGRTGAADAGRQHSDTVGDTAGDAAGDAEGGSAQEGPWVGSGGIRYAGSPLRYSFSEAAHGKTATIIDVGPDGGVAVTCAEIRQPHGMRELRGTLAELREAARANPDMQDDYIRATLTEPEVDAKARLASVFPLLMRVDFDYLPQDAAQPATQRAEELEGHTPAEVFGMLFEATNGRPLRPHEAQFLDGLMSRLAGGQGGDAQ